MDETYKVFVIMHRREEEMKSQKLLDNWERLKILKFFFSSNTPRTRDNCHLRQ